jgi:capsular polysaccharide biosynthesis protein
MLLATVVLVLCVTLMMVPIYKATTTLRIQSQEGQASGQGVDLVGDAFGLRKALELDTELSILKSRRLAEASVRQLHYQLQLEPGHNGLLVLYRKLLALLPGAITERLWLSLPRQPVFSLHVVEVGEITAPARYSLTMLEGGRFVVWQVEEKREIGRGAIGALFQGERFAIRLESQDLQAGDKMVFTLLPFWQATALFQSKTNVVLQPKTEIVEVSAQDASPTLASGMASALTQAYIQFSMQQKTQQAAQLLTFIDRQLAGNLAPFIATNAIGHHQHRPMHANVVVGQLWAQLVITDTEQFAGQIGHHEVVLVVVALQSPIGEAEDHHLMRGAVGTQTVCHHRPPCFDRAKILLRNSSMVWKRLAGSTRIALRMIASTSGGMSGLSCRGGVG